MGLLAIGLSCLSYFKGVSFLFGFFPPVEKTINYIVINKELHCLIWSLKRGFMDHMITRVHLGLIVINRNGCIAAVHDMLLFDLFVLHFRPLEIVLCNLSKN